MLKITAEYIWIDGQRPTAKLRSKTKIVDAVKSLSEVPAWGFDGSSTYQASDWPLLISVAASPIVAKILEAS